MIARKPISDRRARQYANTGVFVTRKPPDNARSGSCWLPATPDSVRNPKRWRGGRIRPSTTAQSALGVEFNPALVPTDPLRHATIDILAPHGKAVHDCEPSWEIRAEWHRRAIAVAASATYHRLKGSK